MAASILEVWDTQSDLRPAYVCYQFGFNIEIGFLQQYMSTELKQAHNNNNKVV